jgi:hypothetical protein
MIQFLYIVGFGSGLLLTYLNAKTSWDGFYGVFQGGKTEGLLMALALTGLSTALNGTTSQIVHLLKTRPDMEGAERIRVIMWAGAMIWDIASSVVGLLAWATGKSKLKEAWEVAGTFEVAIAIIFGILLVLGPMTAMWFHELIKKEGGLTACLFRLFGLSK